MSESKTDKTVRRKVGSGDDRPSGFICPFCRVKVRYSDLLFSDNTEVSEASGNAEPAYDISRNTVVQSRHTDFNMYKNYSDISESDEGRPNIPGTTDEDLLDRAGMFSTQEPEIENPAAEEAQSAPEESDKDIFISPKQDSSPLREWKLGKKALNTVRIKRFKTKNYFCSEFIAPQERTVFGWKANGKPDPDQGIAVAKEWLIEGLLPSHVYTGDIESNSITVYADMICPFCGCEIPAGYCEATPEHIKNLALGGGPGSGKTQYLYAAYRETSSVREQILDAGEGEPDKVDGVPTVDNLGRFVDVVWAKESRRFLDIWGKDFSERDGLKMATEARPVFPVMLTVSPLKNKKNKYFVIIYDIAGEIFQGTDRASKVFAMDYFASVNDILFMVDPAQIFTDLRQKGTRQCSTNISEALAKFSSYPFIRKLDHIAVMLTKSDLLMKYARTTGEPYISKRMCAYHSSLAENHENGFNMEFCDKNSRQIECLLDQGQDTRQKALSRIITHELREIILTSLKPKDESEDNTEIRFFAVSTKVRRDQGDSINFTYKTDNLSVRIRLLEPMMFLMHRWGIIPAQEEHR